MKRTLFAALTGVVVLAGCAKTEVTEVSDNRAISFSNFVTNSVKSIDEKTDLNKFYVYGGFDGTWNLFDGEEVTYNGTNWEYTPVRYWVPNNEYYYAAYSNNNGNGNVSDVTFSETTHELTFNYSNNSAATDDLIYATSGLQQWNGTGDAPEVPFNFKHILSKVAFQFSKAADLNGVELSITNISFKNYIDGIFTGQTITGNQYPIDCWSVTNTLGSLNFTEPIVLLEDGETQNTAYYVVIPQKLTEDNVVEFNVTFSIPNEDGVVDNESEDTKTIPCTVKINDTEGNNWKPGHVYLYSAVIDAENLDLDPIVFNVKDVAKWETEPTIPVEIQ